MSIDYRSLGYFVASVAPLLVVTFFENAISSALGKGVWGILFAAAVVSFFVFVHFYMRRLDEAAWAAQKHAWLWGGTVGIVAGVFLMVLPTPVAGAISGAVAGLAARGGDGGAFSQLDHAFHLGVFYILIAQMIGFLIGWIVWWARR